MDHASIQSMQNRRIKDALQLRNRDRRLERQAILIDGVREIDRAYECGVTICEAFVCQEKAKRPEVRTLLAKLAHGNTPLYEVSPTVFKRLAYGDRYDGVVAVAQIPACTLANMELPSAALVVVLERIEKPGNLGAVLRSADGAGASAVIVADGITDLYNPNVVRASLGTLFATQVCQATSAETIAWIRERELNIVAARPNAPRNYTQADLSGPVAIVLGSEAEGLQSLWRGDDVVSVALPMHGRADSLNVSVATAVLLYEALRQRSENLK